MNPIKFAQMMKYLTRAKNVDPNLPKVTTADKIEIPPKKQTVEEMEAINEFVRRNPRVEKAGGGMLVQPSADGLRPGYAKDYAKEEGLTKIQKQKIINAFPETKFNFDDFKYGVKKYLEGNQNKTNKDYTKVLRFIKKGFTKEMGEGLSARGTPYKDRGKRLSLKDQEKIKSLFELPEGINDWDFKTYKYGIKPDGMYENLLARIVRRLKDKTPWKIAADRGSTKGWMLLQMNRVFENEKKKGVKNLTYQPVYKEINGIKRIIGFKDNTVAGGGNYYYGLDKYAKKNATDITQHGDFKLNQKLVDISKRSFNEPNKVITGLLKEKGFTGKVRLNDLIVYLSGTPGNSKDALLNAVTRHHQSGVRFGSATDDLALTTRVINNTIKGIEGRIANNIIKPDDIQVLKNNNVFVRGTDGKLYGGGAKTPIGQFKQIEKGVETAIRSPNFNVQNFTNFLKDLNKADQIKFARIGCPGKATGGRIGYFEGQNLTACATKGVEKLKNNPLELTGGDQQNLRALSKSAKTLRFLKNFLGPGAVVGELVFEGGVAANKFLNEGMPIKQALGESYINKYLLGEKLKINLEEERKKELLEREMPDGTKIMLEDTPFNIARGEEFAAAKRGERMFLPQGESAVNRRLKERENEMKALYPQLKDANLSNERIDEILKEQNVFSPFTLGFGMQQMQPGIGDTKYNEDVAYQEIRDLINQAVDEDIQSQQFQNIADAGGVANLAGGGIAGLSGGVDQGPQRTSMNPDSQGLQGLMKRVRNR